VFPAFGQQNTSGGGHKDFHENLNGGIILRAAVPQKKTYCAKNFKSIG
jgi:hypothetical protein